MPCAACGQAKPAAACPTAAQRALDGLRDESPVLHVADLTARYGTTQILHGLSFDVPERGCVALVGESGSGKTTLARTIGGLHSDIDGVIDLSQRSLAGRARATAAVMMRRRIQYIFQNPYASLNPRRSIGQSIAIALKTFESVERMELSRRILAVLDQVALAGQRHRPAPA